MRTGTPTVAVRYIGRAPYWQDKPSLYGSGLGFDAGQVRAVPEHLAQSFLRHRDMFEPAASAPVEVVADDTDQVLAKARAEREKQERANAEKLEQLAHVSRMDKAAMAKYAKDRFNEVLKPTDTRESMLRQIQDMIEMYGNM